MEIGLRSLRYFLAVAEEENISRAAERLHIAQPALSRRMSDLESQLGVSLFLWTGRSIRLTMAGRHLLSQATDAVSRLDHVLDSMKELDDKSPRELRVGYVPSMSSHFLPDVLKEMRNLFPWVRVSLFDLDTESQAAGLAKGDLSAAIMVRPGEHSLRGIDYQEIVRFPPCVVMAAGHPLSERVELTTGEIAMYPLVAFCQKGYPEYYPWIQRLFGSRTRFDVISECDTVPTMLAMVESGVGVAIVQEGFEKHSNRGMIARPIVNGDRHALSFGIACRAGENPPELLALVRLVAACGGARPVPDMHAKLVN